MLRDAWWLGGRGIAHGYAFEKLVPRKIYKKEHPEWFGERQPCLTNPQVIKLVADKFRAKLEHHDRVQSFSLGANDNEGFCACPRC